MPDKFCLEVCVDSIDSALAAQEGGADRIELTANLYEGGITPQSSLIELARKEMNIEINMMIRPRGGDFLYSSGEFDMMKRDIELAGEKGMNGVVFGLLTAEGSIDVKRSKELVRLAGDMNVTFHRAFDMTKDPFLSLEQIIEAGANRILSSGMMNDAPSGAKLLKDLIDKSKDRIIIMPGAGINKDNIKDMINITGAKEYHLSGSSLVKSKMKYMNPRVFMGGIPEIPEYGRKVTDVKRIRSVVASMEDAGK